MLCYAEKRLGCGLSLDENDKGILLTQKETEREKEAVSFPLRVLFFVFENNKKICLCVKPKERDSAAYIYRTERKKMINVVFIFRRTPRFSRAVRYHLPLVLYASSNNDKRERQHLSLENLSSLHLLNIDQLCVMRMIIVVIPLRLLLILSLTPFVYVV